MNQPIVIASASRRIVAGLVDFTIVGAYTFGFGWLLTLSREAALALFVPFCIAPWAYAVLLHARYGATLGKFLLGIRVTRTDGSPIGMSEALRRSAVDGVFFAHWTVSIGTALWGAGPEVFGGQSWASLFRELKPLMPNSFDPMNLASSVWSWSEFVTMLFNHRRRALHDFIAGTMVVRCARATPTQLDADNQQKSAALPPAIPAE